MEKAFLKGVFGFPGVFEYFADEAVEHGGPASVELVEGEGIAPGDAAEEGGLWGVLGGGGFGHAGQERWDFGLGKLTYAESREEQGLGAIWMT